MEKIKPEVVKGWKKKHKFKVWTKGIVKNEVVSFGIGNTVVFFATKCWEGASIPGDQNRLVNETASEALEYAKKSLESEGVKEIMTHFLTGLKMTNEEIVQDLERALI